MKKIDLAIIGAGIMGLAHAVHAARAGLSVAVFERSPKASGASIRNFGMLAIVAQAPGCQLESARRSLTHWEDIARETGISLEQTGCLFVAREPEEMSVLEEFSATAQSSGHTATLVSELADSAPDLRPDLLGGLWSPDAWKVDQRAAMTKITDWLQREHNVSFHFGTKVRSVSSPLLDTSIGTAQADHIILCGGSEFASLFPEAFQATGVTTCQLQMLRTHPQPDGWRMHPFVVGGLSLPRFAAFAECPSLPSLIEQQNKDCATHLAHGIHVIGCQESDGSVTIGDSHTYGDASDRSAEIDRLILDTLSRMIVLPRPRIAERWLGHYAHLTKNDALILQPADGVTAVTMTNGQGMTHGFAVAEGVIRDLIR